MKNFEIIYELTEHFIIYELILNSCLLRKLLYKSYSLNVENTIKFLIKEILFQKDEKGEKLGFTNPRQPGNRIFPLLSSLSSHSFFLFFSFFFFFFFPFSLSTHLLLPSPFTISPELRPSPTPARSLPPSQTATTSDLSAIRLFIVQLRSSSPPTTTKPPSSSFSA